MRSWSAIVFSTASAAAAQTGFPPNVVPCMPGCEQFGGRARGDACTDRQPAAETLRQRHDVGHDADRLVRVEPACPSDPGLHFVEDQQRAVPVVISRAASR